MPLVNLVFKLEVKFPAIVTVYSITVHSMIICYQGTGILLHKKLHIHVPKSPSLNVCGTLQPRLVVSHLYRHFEIQSVILEVLHVLERVMG